LPARTDDIRDIPSLLSPDERAHATSLAPLRRVSWIGGRAALHHAALHLGMQLGTVLSTPRGAPALPPGITASISHKPRMAIALVDRSASNTVGVDLEELDRPRPKIARLVLRPEEIARVETLPQAQRWRAIVTAFSLKESVFKAIDPHVQRYVGFQEARVEVLGDHQATVVLSLEGQEGPFEIDARWDIVDQHVITSVRARLG
jgi:4'-phosphopantetheinyl transferase EntD